MCLTGLLILSFGASIGYAQASHNISDFTFVGSFQGHDYYVTKAPDTWQNCEILAQSIGGHLANIGSAEENQFITDNVPVLGWIGLSMDLQTHVWSWTDGVANTFTAWGSIGGQQQPDNYSGQGGQSAALIHSGGITPPSGWDDANPAIQLYGVAELPSSTSAPIQPIPTVLTPSSNYLGYGSWKCEFDTSGQQSTGYDPSSPSFLRNYRSSFKTCLLRSQTK